MGLLAVLLSAAPALAQKKQWNVGILVYNGVYNTEFVAPMDVFDHVNGRADVEVKVFLVAPNADIAVSAENLRFRPNYTFADNPLIDILVVPSFKDYEQDLGRRGDVIDWLRRTAAESKFVLSNCWGAFFLAKAGLLDGRQAMTYPPDIDKLAAQFPRVRAVKGQRFVRDGKFVTGGGGVASYDNALYVVQELWGESVAKGIASGLVMEWDLAAVPHLVAAP